MVVFLFSFLIIKNWILFRFQFKTATLIKYSFSISIQSIYSIPFTIKKLATILKSLQSKGIGNFLCRKYEKKS